MYLPTFRGRLAYVTPEKSGFTFKSQANSAFPELSTSPRPLQVLDLPKGRGQALLALPVVAQVIGHHMEAGIVKHLARAWALGLACETSWRHFHLFISRYL